MTLRRLAASGAAVAALGVAISVLVAPAANATPAETPCGISKKPRQWDHVVWIAMENKGLSDIWKSPDAPYTNLLIRRCGLATNFHAITHPSLPNYIAMTAGTTAGITDNGDPAQNRVSVPSIFSQLGPGGWRVLAESMPSNCYPSNSGLYAVKHNPAPYFTAIADQCKTQNTRLGSRPNLSSKFTFIVPNLRSDTHDASVGTGDRWLASFMPKVLGSKQYRAGRTAVFLTYDEDDGAEGNKIATVVMSPSTPRGKKVGANFTLYSLLKTTEQMLDLPQLAGAASARSMRGGFRL